MGKYKKDLYEDAASKKKDEKKQEKLRKKYKVKEEETRIVYETSNMGKFLIGTAGSLIRTGAAILLITLAVIGLLSILYPGPRAALLLIGKEILNVLKENIRVL